MHLTLTYCKQETKSTYSSALSKLALPKNQVQKIGHQILQICIEISTKIQSFGAGAGPFGWSRSRKNYEVSALAPAPGEL